MSKIAEQKALEVYPNKYIHTPFGINIADIYDFKREAYAEGYNQAMQDFLEKAEKFFKSMYETMGKPNLGDKTIELFKNYIENEM